MSALLFEARGLGLDYPGVPLLQGLNFTLRPGLSLVQGGDGRGKSSLLRLIAGELAPTRGQLLRAAGSTVCLEHPADAVHDPVVVQDWLGTRRAQRGGDWRPALADQLVDALDLRPHLHKPMVMLSTGSRRKVGWVATAASGAQLSLIDSPFAALDARSIRVLTALLVDAAQDTQRAWVLADYALPAGLARGALAALIDLGD
jgi:ABC-type transport system involved in cytochrome c biogenesis ATPase subunit